VPEPVLAKFYGCGTPLPTSIEGLSVLDLGCGSGRDCYLASSLVGPLGKVTGIDMTEEQVGDRTKNHSPNMINKIDTQLIANRLSFRPWWWLVMIFDDVFNSMMFL
jgi:ubiquinone/menaquinone biosynthesis C-methylase UbiE